MDIDIDEVSCTSKKDQRFDSIIGSIEDIVISEEFQSLQDSFMLKYYKEFDDTEENKFIYTDIFHEYTSTIEKHLNNELARRVSGFSMEKFISSLQEHKDEITGDIFDMLLSFSDFVSFKEMFLDYKAEKEGRNIDLNEGFVIRPLNSADNNPDMQNKLHMVDMSSPPRT